MLGQRIQEQAVCRVELRDRLVLDLAGSNELVICGPLRLTFPSSSGGSLDDVVIDPSNARTPQPSLLDLEGATCTRADCGGQGPLHLEFSTGHQIDVDGEHGRAWKLQAKQHGALATPFRIAEKTAALVGPATRRLWTEATNTALTATHRILPTSAGHGAPHGCHHQSHLDFLDASEMEREMHHL